MLQILLGVESQHDERTGNDPNSQHWDPHRRRIKMSVGGRGMPEEMAFTAEDQSRISRMFDLPLWEEDKEQCTRHRQNQDDQRAQMTPSHPASM